MFSAREKVRVFTVSGRPKGSRNRATLRAIHQIEAARRRLRKQFGDDIMSGGVAATTALVLTELTRSIYEPPVRLGAAKELSALEYPRLKPVEVDPRTGEPVEIGGAEQVIQVELWDATA